jgi:predicted nucleic acid-binding protein
MTENRFVLDTNAVIFLTTTGNAIPSGLQKEKTIALRRTTKLKLPDCIVAATAIVLDAVLLTDDDHLLVLSWQGLRTQHIF